MTGPFPYEELRAPDGGYFYSWKNAAEFGFSDDQIWSVAECDGVFCYGPPHHCVNVLGYIGTKETHDQNTYYEEDITSD